MLYKKFHRSYVRQFKKGVEFNYKTYRDVVNKEPYDIGCGNIRITGINYDLVIVYSDGTTNCNIKIERDAIQKIS